MKSFLFLLFPLLVGCGSFRPSAPEKKTDFFHVQWAKNLDPSYVSGNLPIGLGAPRVFNDILYMGTQNGVMNAYDLESGRILWAYNEKSPLNGPVEFFNDHVAYGSLAGRFFVRHYLTGELKFAIDLGSPVESAPLFHNGHLFVYLRGHQFVHLDAETGKIIWVYKRAVPVTTTLQRTTKPLIIGNKVIIGFADGFVGALSLDEGLLLWETKLVDQGKFVDVDLNPLLAGGTVVTGSPAGELKAINPENGAISRSYGLHVQAHPFLKGEQLLLGTDEGEVVLMSLAGEILKKAKISSQAISAVAWWKGNLVAASFDGMLRAVDPLTMKVVDEFALGYNSSAVYSDIVVADDYMSISSSRNRLYVFH